MAALRQYVIAVTAAATLCGILLEMVKNGGASGVVRMLCGLFLTVTVLSPIRKLDFGDLLPELDTFPLEGSSVASQGEKSAQAAMADIIKAETEAYILDKATGMDVLLTVSVTLKEEAVPVPEKAVLSGNISPNNRRILSDWLEKELGITKENQLWTG